MTDNIQLNHVFKETFVNSLCLFQQEIAHLALGNSSFPKTRRDWLLEASVGLGTSAITGLLIMLAALGVISTLVSAGLGAAVTVGGVATGVGIAMWRQHKKKHQYRESASFFPDDDLKEQFEKIADRLIKMYASNLNQCSLEETKQLGLDCANAIVCAILNHKVDTFDKLNDPTILSQLVQHSMKKFAHKPHVNTMKKKHRFANVCGLNSLFHHANDGDFKEEVVNKKSCRVNIH